MGARDPAAQLVAALSSRAARFAVPLRAAHCLCRFRQNFPRIEDAETR